MNKNKNRQRKILEEIANRAMLERGLLPDFSTDQLTVAEAMPDGKIKVMVAVADVDALEIAAEHGFRLPGNPDSKVLEEFLTKEKAEDPLRFPDLSLVVIKLLGSGEYLAELPEDAATGHFGLAVKDYTHSTAPNRRYPDLITQRLLKSAIVAKPLPYSKKELDDLATQCTEMEDA